MSVVAATARAMLSLRSHNALISCLFNPGELSPVEVRFNVPLIDGLLIREVVSDPHLDVFPAELPRGPQPLMPVDHDIVVRDLDRNIQALAQALLQSLELGLVQVGKKLRLPRVTLQISRRRDSIRLSDTEVSPLEEIAITSCFSQALPTACSKSGNVWADSPERSAQDVISPSRKSPPNRRSWAGFGFSIAEPRPYQREEGATSPIRSGSSG